MVVRAPSSETKFLIESGELVISKQQLPEPAFPAPAERRYERVIDDYWELVFEGVRQRIIPKIPGWNARGQEQLRPVTLDQNDWEEEMLNEVDILIAEADREAERGLTTELFLIGLAIANWNMKEQNKVASRGLKTRQGQGFEPIRSEPWVNPRINAWAKENIGFIQNVNTAITKTQLVRIINEGVTAGRSDDDIINRILGTKGPGGIVPTEEQAFNRYRLIVRDQTSKLNGLFTQLRHEAMGLTKYKWRTQRDERVRPVHRDLDGKIFTWAKGPSSTGGLHPGQPINCRCWAEPVWESITQEDS